tara:strand:- start:239 stop:457 length:219 start_codon:yes stop_codon:yes gene_type:complete
VLEAQMVASNMSAEESGIVETGKWRIADTQTQRCQNVSLTQFDCYGFFSPATAHQAVPNVPVNPDHISCSFL